VFTALPLLCLFTLPVNPWCVFFIWAATALLLLGVVVVAYAMRATSSPDALVTATKIAAAAFGLPAAIAYAVAYWIDARGERFEADRARDSDDDHNHPGLGAS